MLAYSKPCCLVHPLPTLLTFLLLFANQQIAAHPGSHERMISLGEQIDHSPSDSSLRIHRALELIQENSNYTQAKVDLETAHRLGINEKSRSLYNYAMGTYHFKQGKYSTATPFFRRCIELEKEQHRCHRSLADSLIAVGDTETAIEALKHAQLSQSIKPDDYLRLAQILTENKQAQKAIEYLDLAQHKFGVLPHFEKYTIELLTNTKGYKEALSRHTALKPHYGRNMSRWLFEQGLLYEKMEQPAKAKDNFKEALIAIGMVKGKSKAFKVLEASIRSKLDS